MNDDVWALVKATETLTETVRKVEAMAALGPWPSRSRTLLDELKAARQAAEDANDRMVK